MATQTQLRLKLMVDAKSKKVLFAEAGKDVVDFLFGLLTMQVSSVIKLLTKEGMVGSIGSIYESVQTLDDTYVLSTQAKNSLISPTTAPPGKNTLFLTEGSSSATAKKYYGCSSRSNESFGTSFGTGLARSYASCRENYTDVCGTKCPSCGNQLRLEMHYVEPNAVAAADGESAGGFVKGVVTYTVMDDLTVMPMSTISSITLLNKFNIRDVGSLTERNVNLGMKEGLELLKASLQSKNVLTDVFIGKKMETVG